MIVRYGRDCRSAMHSLTTRTLTKGDEPCGVRAMPVCLGLPARTWAEEDDVSPAPAAPPTLVERFVLTARSEVTDRMLIFGERHLRRVLSGYAAHYNTARPHRALRLRPPRPTSPVPEPVHGRVRRRPILGGSSMSTGLQPETADQAPCPCSGTRQARRSSAPKLISRLCTRPRVGRSVAKHHFDHCRGW
jgi:hypothetical protein